MEGRLSELQAGVKMRGRSSILIRGWGRHLLLVEVTG